MSQELHDEKVNQSLMDHIILGVAHELNNPNAFVRMNASNIKKMLSLLTPCFEEFEKNHPGQKFGPYTLSQLRGKLMQLNESNLEATIRIMTIADKLKQCSSQAMTQSVTLSLRKILDSVVHMHHFLIDQFCTLSLEGDPNYSINVLGHELQLEQAFSILITNACDAIKERFTDDPKKNGMLKIVMASDGQNVKIIFSDNGNGVPPGVMQKIFTPYFTTKPQGVGDGLGLPICRAILERHGGTIELQSRVGEGTQFTITLPKTTGI